MSWEPLDLRYLDDRAEVVPTLGGVVYLGGTKHTFSGPPESAKTIGAYAIALEHVRSGERVLLIDKEMGPFDTRDRLRDMGATDDDLASLIYVRPDVKAHAETLADLVTHYPATLAVIDAAAGFYSLQGLDENSGSDVERFSDVVVAPLSDRGVTTIVIDHVVKKSEDRGSWAVGSQRKLGSVDVSLGFSTVVPFGRGREGLIRVRTNKDRLGHLPRPNAAELVIRSDPETHAITWEWRACEGQGDDEYTFRPTALMERVSRFLEEQAEPVSRNAIEVSVKGRAAYLRLAIERLVFEGFAAETDDPYRPLRSVQPFREAEDRAEAESSSSSSQARPEFVQDEPPPAAEFVPSSRPPTGGRGDEPLRLPEEAAAAAPAAADSSAALAHENAPTDPLPDPPQTLTLAPSLEGFKTGPGERGFALELEQARDRGELSVEDFDGWRRQHLEVRRKRMAES